MPPAATIDDVIIQCSEDIGALSYGGVSSLFTVMQTWTDSMFLDETSIFPPSADLNRNPGQRVVTDWYAQHLMALDSIEGPGVGESGVVGTAAVIDAVFRVANAVKYAVINGNISSAQQTSVVALYNSTWA